MTRYAPLWQQAGVYSAQVDRGLLNALWPNSGSVGPTPAAVANTMNVSIPPGTAAVALAAPNLTELCRWDAAEVVTLAAAPASGQSRIDLVVLQVRDAAIDGGANNDFVFQVVTGTPGVTPAAPAVPANAYAVAQVTVPGAVANLNTATVADVRGAFGAGYYAVQTGNGTSGTFSFTGIPAGNRNLVLKYFGQTTNPGFAAVSLQFNGDTAAHYYANQADFSNVGAYGETLPGTSGLAGTVAGTTSQNTGSGSITVFGYSQIAQRATWQYSSFRIDSGAAGGTHTNLGGGMWLFTLQVINRVDLILSAGNWQPGSYAQLWTEGR
jgi:hypothetical protein